MFQIKISIILFISLYSGTFSVPSFSKPQESPNPHEWFNEEQPTPYFFYRHGEPWNSDEWADSYHYNPELKFKTEKNVYSNWYNLSFIYPLPNGSDITLVEHWRKFRHHPFQFLSSNKSNRSIFDFLQSREQLKNRILNKLPKAKIYFHSDRLLSPIKPSEGELVKLFIGSVETLEYHGNGYLTNGGKLEHDAEQIEHLVEKGKVPRDFLAISRVYRQILYDRFLKPLSEGVQMPFEGCCFILTDSEFQYSHYLQNTLIYYPPNPNNQKSALHPDVDWKLVEEKYKRGDIVQIDQVLDYWALEAAYNFCLEATIYFEQKQGYVGAYMTSGLRPPGGIMDQITKELRLAMPNIIGDKRLSNFWSYKYNNALPDDHIKSQSRKWGLTKHADPAEINLNMWLTPDEACLDKIAGGMTIYDIGVDTVKDYYESQKRNFEQTIDLQMVKEKTRYFSVKYVRNRMILFNSRLIHSTGHLKNSQDLSFKKGYKNRRISLTWLFGNFIDQITGQQIKLGPRL